MISMCSVTSTVVADLSLHDKTPSALPVPAGPNDAPPIEATVAVATLSPPETADAAAAIDIEQLRDSTTSQVPLKIEPGEQPRSQVCIKTEPTEQSSRSKRENSERSGSKKSRSN